MPEITLSLFQGYSDTYPVDKSLTDIVEMILHDPHLADNTAKHRYCRQNGWTKDATRTKMACPCFAVAVRFSQGKKRENISGWTHLCLVDFDHIPPEKKEACLQLIRQDPHTLLAYTTISKEGIRIICPYICHPDFYFRNETELYKLAFEKINRHYAALIGHEYDEKCKNITRLSGLAHDPEAWYCENALPFEIEAPASLLDETKSRKKQERLQKVVDAIRTHLADKGVEYTDHQRNNYIMRTGYLFNAYGVDQQTATAWGVKQFADYDGDVAGIFRSCYRKTDEYGTLKLPSHSGKKSSPNDAATSVVSDIEAFLSTQAQVRNGRNWQRQVQRPDGPHGQHALVPHVQGGEVGAAAGPQGCDRLGVRGAIQSLCQIPGQPGALGRENRPHRSPGRAGACHHGKGTVPRLLQEMAGGHGGFPARRECGEP